MESQFVLSVSSEMWRPPGPMTMPIFDTGTCIANSVKVTLPDGIISAKATVAKLVAKLSLGTLRLIETSTAQKLPLAGAAGRACTSPTANGWRSPNLYSASPHPNFLPRDGCAAVQGPACLEARDARRVGAEAAARRRAAGVHGGQDGAAPLAGLCQGLIHDGQRDALHLQVATLIFDMVNL